MVSKKEWVLKAFRGEKVDRIPVGFWHHFTEEKDFGRGSADVQVVQQNIEGHKRFIEAVRPDFIKLMSDGFFTYPNGLISTKVRSVKELAGIQSIGADHPWFQQQVDLIKHIKSTFVEDILAIYNIFSPATYLKWQLSGKVADGDQILADFLKEDAQLLRQVLQVIADDIVILVKKVIQEADIEGIYLSVQSIQDNRISSKDYKEIIAPSDVALIEAAAEAGGLTVLHICGYEGATNDVSLFKDYPVQVVNWAVVPEGITLAEGRQLFDHKTVLGGFVNTKEGLLYKGNKEAIQAEVHRLIKEAGDEGIIIGADCTIPSDIDPQRILWVKEAVAE